MDDARDSVTGAEKDAAAAVKPVSPSAEKAAAPAASAAPVPAEKAAPDAANFRPSITRTSGAARVSPILTTPSRWP